MTKGATRPVLMMGVFGLGHQWRYVKDSKKVPAKIAKLLDQAYRYGYGTALFSACRELERFAAKERRNER